MITFKSNCFSLLVASASFFAVILLSASKHDDIGHNLVQKEGVKVMTLGVFHFAYPNLDAVKTAEEDQISVLDEPWQSQIISIANAIAEFSPTIIAVELQPEMQSSIDEMYAMWRAGSFAPRKGEVYQLGFRIGAQLGLEKIWCVDDPGHHYKEIEAIFQDKERMAKFENYYFSSSRRDIVPLPASESVKCITKELIYRNHPDTVRNSLASYLVHPFGYEEEPGDFTGVDFETGRWYNRNLRILRNIQRIPATNGDRILLIVGSGHLNLLNIFFDISPEYQLVSPLPYLEKAILLQ
jgi:hypothetical protein